MENLLTYLEKVYLEYREYKEYLKTITKPISDLRKEVAEKIDDKTTEQQVAELFLEKVEKVGLHQRDFVNQQLRLFYTVEAYKDNIEIPQEILNEVKDIQFQQIFSVINGKVDIVNQEAYDFTKDQIKNEMTFGIEEFKKRYL